MKPDDNTTHDGEQTARQYLFVGGRHEKTENWPAAAEATRLCPGDSRAWHHLEHLMEARPELATQDVDLGKLIADIRISLEQHGCIVPSVEPSPMYRPMTIPKVH